MDRERNNKNPCNHCPDRSVTCHSECEKYKAWVDARQEWKDIILQKTRADRAMVEYKRSHRRHEV